MYNFTPETIYSAWKNLKALDSKVGGLFCILACAEENITVNKTYEINGAKLREKLSYVFDWKYRYDFADAKPSFVIFAKNWEKTFFKNDIKNQIDILSCAVFFLRRFQFSQQPTKKEIIKLFIEKFNLVNYKDLWFDDSKELEVNFNENDSETNQKEFYTKITSEQFKSLTFSDTLKKSAYDLSAAGHIQTLYSAKGILKTCLYSDESLDNYYIMQSNKTTIANTINHPLNRIIFGAPGTGKSYTLNKDSSNYFESTNIERVTFHPNYSYAQFVGTYKPTMESSPKKELLTEKDAKILDVLKDSSKSAQKKYDELYPIFKDDNSLTRLPILIGLYSDEPFQTRKQDGSAAAGDNSVERNHGKAIRSFVNLENQSSNQITYKYVPGPFMRVYAKAKQNPEQGFLLVIEEINRANVAAVFGEVFQLLDRQKDGTSEYPVDASEDVKQYLLERGIDENKLSLPNNMYIWATMNSADQGVFPMDTAFKRRWEFEYLGIDEGESEVESYEFKYKKDGTPYVAKWNDIRKFINDRLIDLGINEDKLLGPFFIARNTLENTEELTKVFKSKVLMYLFEDAAKMKVKQLFNLEDNKYIYSKICKAFDEKGFDIFQDNRIDERAASETAEFTENISVENNNA